MKENRNQSENNLIMMYIEKIKNIFNVEKNINNNLDLIKDNLNIIVHNLNYKTLKKEEIIFRLGINKIN